MRNFTTNPARTLIQEAVKAVHNDVSRAPQLMANTTASIVPSSGTTAGTNDDGTTFTIHTAITQLDATNSGATTGGW